MPLLQVLASQPSRAAAGAGMTAHRTTGDLAGQESSGAQSLACWSVRELVRSTAMVLVLHDVADKPYHNRSSKAGDIMYLSACGGQTFRGPRDSLSP